MLRPWRAGEYTSGGSMLEESGSMRRGYGLSGRPKCAPADFAARVQRTARVRRLTHKITEVATGMAVQGLWFEVRKAMDCPRQFSGWAKGRLMRSK